MFPALTARTAYEVFYTRLGQHTLSVANYWYDPRHRDLYLEYSVYLAVIDNQKKMESNGGSSEQQKAMSMSRICDDNNCNTISTTSMLDMSNTTITNSTITQNNDNITKRMEARVSSAIAAVSAASIKVAEGHDDVIDRTAAAVNDIMIDVLAKDADCYSYGDNSINDNSNINANTRKLGLTRLQKLVLIGGPDDGVISPWQSRYLILMYSRNYYKFKPHVYISMFINLFFFF